MQAPGKRAPCVIVPSTPIRVPAPRKAVPGGSCHRPVSSCSIPAAEPSVASHSVICVSPVMSAEGVEGARWLPGQMYKYEIEVVFFQRPHFALQMEPLWPVSHWVPPWRRHSLGSGRAWRRHSATETLLLWNSFPALRPKKLGYKQALGQAKKPRVFSDFRGENVIFIGKFSSSVVFVIRFVCDWFIQAVEPRS